jgi:translation initiation factor 1 (eIF-1/SUI1)
MPDLTQTNFARNYEKAQPSSLFGTRELAYLVVEMNTDVESNYLESKSLYEQAIKALQQRVEIYAVGRPSGEFFTVIASATTAPFNIDALTKQQNQHNQDGERVTALEDVINTTCEVSCYVWNAILTGSSFNYDD